MEGSDDQEIESSPGKLLIATVNAMATVACGTAFAQGQVQLWRLDCGEMIIDDISFFSDAFAYSGLSATISNGCYLIRNGEEYLLWDLGLAEDYLDNTEPYDGWTSSISITLEDQLGEIGVSTSDINYVAISHYHGDHIGQGKSFDKSRLLISQADFERIEDNPSHSARRRLTHWFDKSTAVTTFTGDHDVFGDGLVRILAMPGHTPGHSALMVWLPETGPVLLTGDLYHFRSEIGTQIVSNWNTSRAETLASYARLEAIVGRFDPLVIVQHDPLDIVKLPAFPQSAK